MVDLSFLCMEKIEKGKMSCEATDTYMRKKGYTARAFLLGLTAELMKGYAAQEL